VFTVEQPQLSRSVSESDGSSFRKFPSPPPLFNWLNSVAFRKVDKTMDYISYIFIAAFSMASKPS
ncbi:hypothetical protein M378DRAFT_168792, partial [Amanita muscaria Koide BX008]